MARALERLCLLCDGGKPSTACKLPSSRPAQREGPVESQGETGNGSCWAYLCPTKSLSPAWWL